MADSREELRRWWGAFCLVVAAGMLIWGQTLLKGHLRGAGFVIYWILCFAFTLAAIIVALLDLRAVRRRARQEQRNLVERTLHEVDTEYSVKADPPTDSDAKSKE